MNKPEQLSQIKCFGGSVETYVHPSSTCRTPMKFSIYRPPQANEGRVPVLYWLSGLTCSEENFMVKAGAQRMAARHGILLAVPDTSPREARIPGEAESWELGIGAGFYVDATEDPWAEHFQMYSYVTEELPAILREYFPADGDRQSISGHSMGGHGALVCGLKNPSKYRSVSAFAPICAPSQCPWGENAFTAYLGKDKKTWAEWDATELVKKVSHRMPLLIDQGSVDKFLDLQLKPQLLRESCSKVDYPLHLRMQQGYDHSYHFISTFIEEHVEYHARALRKQDATS